MEIIVALALLGLCFGSFVNALVWRLHEQARHKKNVKELSISTGRSMCPHCKHTLAGLDLIPVLSWVVLRGRCRYCHKPISPQYPFIEILTSSLFILSYIAWPRSFTGLDIAIMVLWLTSVAGFVALALYDVKWMLLPNKIVLPLIWIASTHALIEVLRSKNIGEAVFALLFSLLILPGLFYLLYQVSSGRWIGGGDVKLAVVLGLLVAKPMQAFLVLFIASLIGTIISLPLMATGKLQTKSRIPFGPLLLAATYVVYLFGNGLTDSLSRLLVGV